MNCKLIIMRYLKDAGYDGLYNEDCGCEVDDLMPCDSPCDKCEPGYKHVAPEDDPEGYDFYIRPRKPGVEDD